jgi:DNA modification methylase
MNIEIWLTERATPYKKNARTLTDRAVDVVAASIKEYGWRQPIVVDEHGVVIVGHTRLLAAKKLGLEKIPVHIATDLTPEQVRAYRLADNRTADESSWDMEILTEELAEMQRAGVDLGITAFSEAEQEELLRPAPQTDEDVAPNPSPNPISRTRDIWLLGGHRVMCGDATSPDDVAALVATRKADMAITAPAIEEEPDAELPDMVFTDPPYNVDYEGYTKDKLKIQSDRMTKEDFLRFLRSTFACYATAIKPTASVYVCHPSSYQREFQDVMEAAGFRIRTQIIWAKNTFAWGHGRYKFQHEPIFYAHLSERSDRWYGDKTQSTLWQANKPSASRLHPTMKPIELIEHAIENSSQPRQIVLDLFGGSGSTLIAAEKTGRRARLMELDPKYTDVIVARWQLYTGLQASLEGDGRTFEQVAAARSAEQQAA